MLHIWQCGRTVETCAACGHESHGAGPCLVCAQTQTGTCWQAIKIVGGDGDESAAGLIELATGKETQPCLMCRKWENVETKRVVEYFIQRGLEALPNGCFKTPIVKDYPGRKSLVLDPKNYGFCRRDLIPTDAQATCEGWVPTKRLSDFQDRMGRRR